MDKFRPPGSWSCDTCMVQNGADVTRCPACDSLRATSVSSAPPSGDRGEGLHTGVRLVLRRQTAKFAGLH